MATSTSAERMRALRKRRHAAGLCEECGTPKKPRDGDRGRTGAHADDADLDHATDAILGGRENLSAWRAIARSLSAAQRTETRDAALAKIALGIRFATEVLRRHGYAI